MAFRAICPQSEKDWENIAATMRTRTAKECRKQAMEVLKLNASPRESRMTSVSADVVDALRKTKVSYIKPIIVINVRSRFGIEETESHLMHILALGLTIYLT